MSKKTGCIKNGNYSPLFFLCVAEKKNEGENKEKKKETEPQAEVIVIDIGTGPYAPLILLILHDARIQQD
jgi:hypothetical protein